MSLDVESLNPEWPASRTWYRQTHLPKMMATITGLKDLAPEIYRQRLVIEGYPKSEIFDSEIREYLSQLSDVCEMKTLIEPVTHKSPLYGWAGWIHWETSGAHFYAWEQPRLFFSVDIYTCKKFSVEKVVTFTKEYFGASDLVFKEM